MVLADVIVHMYAVIVRGVVQDVWLPSCTLREREGPQGVLRLLRALRLLRLVRRLRDTRHSVMTTVEPGKRGKSGEEGENGGRGYVQVYTSFHLAFLYCFHPFHHSYYYINLLTLQCSCRHL